MTNLSPQQERIYTLQKTGGNYRMVSILSIDGDVDVGRLRSAVQRIESGHHILQPYDLSCIELVDLSTAGIPEARKRIKEWFDAERHGSSVSLERALSRLIKLGEDRHSLLISIPSAAADAGTAAILAKAIAREYGGEAASDVILQYSEYAEIVNELANQNPGSYWSPDLPDKSNLPFRRQSLPDQPFSTQSLSIDTGGEWSSRLESTARNLDAHPEVLLFAAWQALLWRYCTAGRVVVGYCTDGRTYEELAATPGPFSKCVPVVGEFSCATTFAIAVRNAQAAIARAVSRQDEYRADPAAPYLSCCFSFLDVRQSFETHGARFAVEKAYCAIDRFDVQLTAWHKTGSLGLELSFNPSTFPARDIEILAASYRTLIDAAVDDPNAPLDSLELLPDSIQKQTALLLANKGSLGREPGFVHREFERRAKVTPDAIAFQQGTTSVSYGDLNAKANRVARYLQGFGVGPEAIIAIAMPTCVEALVSMLASLKTGAAYLPIDPASPPARIRLLVEDAGAKLVLTLAGQEQELSDFDVPVLRLDADWGLIERHSDENLTCDLSPLNLAYVIYTSGSTGKPKGVMICHRGFANYVNWAASSYLPHGDAGAPLHSPLAFDMSITSVFAPLISGGAVIATSDRNPGALADVLRQHPRFGFVKLTPAHARILSFQLEPEELSRSTGVVILGGEALSSSDIEQWRSIARDTVFVNEYGPTETVVGSCIFRVSRESRVDGPIPIGRPIANTYAYVLDGHLHMQPSGVPGELYLGGAGVARGYLGRADVTAERFIPDPFAKEPGARLYRTGDFVILGEDGNLEYCGRIDHQVKVRGYRVEPGEIEATLMLHPAVRDASVLSRADERGGEQLTAYLTTSEIPPSPSVLRSYLESRLPNYMIPAEFVFLDSLPLTTNGKVDRAALISIRAHQGRAMAIYASPRTEEEEILAGIWGQVLGVERVGIDDRYFALGGDSIKSIQIASRAQSRGISISIDQIFKFQTIRELAAEVERTRTSSEQHPGADVFSLISEADRNRIPPGIEDAYPLARLQAGMVFHRQLRPESSVYHDIFYFHVRAPLNPDAMGEAIKTLARRHPILRTSFDLSYYSEPLQLVHADSTVPLTVEDHSHLSPAEQAAALEAWVLAEQKRDFDWSRPPLLRFHIFVRSPETFVFALTFHHAILDGWSDAMMLIELALTYRRVLRSELIPSKPLAASYRDFIALERESRGSSVDLAFWREYLRGSQPVTLPPRRAVDVADGAAGVVVKTIDISEEVSYQLQALARKLAVPLKNVLLAAHVRVMSVLGGQRDVMTTMTSVGRPEVADGDKVLGLHLNSTPFRLTLTSGSWSTLIQAVFEAERSALAHRRFPMADLQEILDYPRLADSHFYFTHYHIVRELEAFPELQILDQGGYEETSFALVANFSLDPTTLKLNPYLTCDRDRFSSQQVSEMAGYYAVALTAIAKRPETAVDSEPLLSEVETAKILKDWNTTATGQKAQEPVHRLVEAHAAKSPDAVALVDGVHHYTYRELDERSGQVASYLQSRGVGPEIAVGVALPRSAAALIAILGIFKAEGTCVPLDTTYPLERLDFLRRDAALNIILDSDTVVPKAAWIGRPTILADTAAYIVYTSGSTGRSKGIVLSHRVLSNLIAWHNAHLTNGVRTLHFASIGFDVSFYEMFATWCSGGTLVLAGEEARHDAAMLLRLLTSERIEKAVLPVVALQQLASICLASGEFPHHLRELIVTGDQLQVTPGISAFFNALPACTLHNHYGPSEAHVVTAYSLPSRPDLWDVLPPIGRPIDNTRAYILDDDLRPVPIGVAGELLIGGEGLARGYLNQPGLSGDRFIPDPFGDEPGARLYRTGDLARFRDDGNIEFLGRIDSQVKIRGYRVELGEIESILCEHPGVREAAVAVREDAAGEKHLVAYGVYEPKDDRPGDSSMRDFLRAKLPEYMIPFQFVWLDALPLNVNGKVDRRALPAPDPRQRDVDKPYVAPRTVLEETIAEMWAEVLKVERIGVEDSFFDSGGNSLLATRLISLLRQELEIEVPLRCLFERPTVARFAELIDEILANEAASLTDQEKEELLGWPEVSAGEQGVH